MAWDDVVDTSPERAGGSDLTLRFDHLQLADSFLLDEHSYDNYLDGLQDDASFTVPPFASSTPIARKESKAAGPKSRLAQLRGGAMKDVPSKLPSRTHPFFTRFFGKLL